MSRGHSHNLLRVVSISREAAGSLPLPPRLCAHAFNPACSLSSHCNLRLASDDALSLLGPALIALACFSWDQVRPPSSPRLRTCWLRSRTCMRRHLLAWFVLLVTCASEPGGGLPCRWNVDQQAATVSLRGGCAGACSGTVLARPSLCEQLVWSSVVEGSVPTLRRSGCAVRFIARKSANVDRPRANRVRPID